MNMTMREYWDRYNQFESQMYQDMAMYEDISKNSPCPEERSVASKQRETVRCMLISFKVIYLNIGN